MHCVCLCLVQATGEMGDLLDFQKGQILGAHLAGAFVSLTANLLVF